MQNRSLLILLVLLMARVLSLNAQNANQDSTYKKYFLGGTLLMLANLIPNDPNRADFVQLNVGYRVTPKNVVFLELKGSKFNWPLGMPWEAILDKDRQQYNFPGYVRQYIIGLAYNRFWWKGLYTGVLQLSKHFR